MKYAEFQRRIIDILVDKIGDDITIDTKIDDMDLDSLDLVELSMEFEKEFNIEIPDDTMSEIDDGKIKKVIDFMDFLGLNYSNIPSRVIEERKLKLKKIENNL